MNEILFRGWSEDKQEWIYGYLLSDRDKEIYYIAEGIGCFSLEIDSDSIGIYINKDDKNGKKIFCSCANAKYGSDILIIESMPNFKEYTMVGDSIKSWNKKYKTAMLNLSYEQGNFKLSIIDMDDTNWWVGSPNIIGLEVISNQWEEHLKEINK